ncbi:hypothetical protein K470DRAFT_219441 [Piedraia hortae CBS 480.64]|uniref:PQ loop repeat protein n=1 Tax=Piedraia hortae CBS 480.64 TaxID=1314780 RepID=A0A6A7BWD4_9PEZI|nr:hypothetical protein K470DRAFT_219441 [Piedraia hortae CBS 480.64]
MHLDRCELLAHPDPLPICLAALVTTGILVSYVPQHKKLISNGTSEGLSPWWVLLGALSSIAAVGNILTLPASRQDAACCTRISGGACAAALLGIAQIGLQWTCFMFIVMLFLIYFPRDSGAKRRDGLVVGCVTLLALLFVGIISVALVAAWPNQTLTWANFLGSVAGVLAAVQYVPQIWYTYRLGAVKSLSLLTMLIQVPGSFVFAFSLWLRVGWDGWSAWLVYIITGLLQGVLLSMAGRYYMRKEHNTDASDADYTPDTLFGHERTPLLRRLQPQAIDPRNWIMRMIYGSTPPELDSDASSIARGNNRITRNNNNSDSSSNNGRPA